MFVEGTREKGCVWSVRVEERVRGAGESWYEHESKYVGLLPLAVVSCPSNINVSTSALISWSVSPTPWSSWGGHKMHM